ncbi:hypothetical protein ACU8NW_14795 [Rhizobium leguminosarum]
MMSEHAKRATIVALILIAVMSLLPPAMIGGQRGAVWKFFYDFQNLLAGLAAIAAAGITVRQMRSSERQQWERHKLELNISTQRDRMAILRLEAILLPQLQAIENACTSFDFPAVTGEEEPIWTKETRSNLFRAAYACKRYRHPEVGLKVASCAHLFTPEMDKSIGAFNLWTELIVDNVPDDSELYRLLQDGGRPEWFSTLLAVPLNVLGQEAIDFRVALHRWREELLTPEWSQY